MKDNENNLSFLFHLLLNRFNISWNQFDKSTENELYLSLAEPLAVSAAESLFIANSMEEDKHSVIKCILPVAELENQALEKIVSFMRTCHKDIDLASLMLNRVGAIDILVNSALTLDSLATSFASLKSCEELIKGLAHFKVLEIKHLRQYLESIETLGEESNENESNDLLQTCVDDAHTVEMLLYALQSQLEIASRVSMEIKDTVSLSTGSASLAYWREIFEETKLSLEEAVDKLRIKTMMNSKIAEPLYNLDSSMPYLKYRVQAEVKDLSQLKDIRQTVLDIPTKLDQCKSNLKQKSSEARYLWWTKSETLENLKSHFNEIKWVSDVSTKLNVLRTEHASLRDQRSRMLATIDFKQDKKSRVESNLNASSKILDIGIDLITSHEITCNLRSSNDNNNYNNNNNNNNNI